MSKTLDQCLVDNPVFSFLSKSDRDAVSSLAVQKKVAKGETLAHHADDWPYLFMVEKGIINGLKESREGRSLIVIGVSPGELFWGLSFFEERIPMPVILQAQKASRVWLWHRDALLPILWRNGRFSWELSRLMVRRMQHASDMVEGLAFQPVRSRLAQLLLGHFGKDAVGDFVARDMTLDEMAARVSTKREMVCRLLYEFADEGAIEISRTEFMITDQSKLKVYSEKGKS